MNFSTPMKLTEGKRHHTSFYTFDYFLKKHLSKSIIKFKMQHKQTNVQETNVHCMYEEIYIFVIANFSFSGKVANPIIQIAKLFSHIIQGLWGLYF